jgi:hypothetical protein
MDSINLIHHLGHRLPFISASPTGRLPLFAVPGGEINLHHVPSGGNRPPDPWQEKSCQESEQFPQSSGPHY